MSKQPTIGNLYRTHYCRRPVIAEVLCRIPDSQPSVHSRDYLYGCAVGDMRVLRRATELKPLDPDEKSFTISPMVRRAASDLFADIWGNEVDA